MKKLAKHISNLGTVLNVRRQQKQINLPTLLLVGSYDRAIDGEHTLNGFKRYFKNKSTLLQYFMFENSGHLCFEEEQDLFVNKILDFCK